MSKPIAYDAYEQLADAYARLIDTKPHNAYYERPAMIGLWPELSGLQVLDAGCGPGVYAEQLRSRGARVVSIDVSPRMLELARQRLGPTADLRCVDMTGPMDMFESAHFDMINAPLCLDYIEDWHKLFSQFRRILKPGGLFQFSCSHPASDAELFGTEDYFSVERVELVWKGFGIPVNVPSFRRSLEQILMPVMETGFQLEKVVEPLPTEQFRLADPRRYAELMHRPVFLCIQARKPPASNSA